MFYGVYIYNAIESSSSSSVFLVGIYETLNQAKIRLNELVPNYEKHYKNTVKSKNMIGWINEYQFGDIDYNGLTCCQPHSSIYLF